MKFFKAGIWGAIAIGMFCVIIYIIIDVIGDILGIIIAPLLGGI